MMKLRLAHVRLYLASLGMRITWNGEYREYRVAPAYLPERLAEPEAYYTDDLLDAMLTAERMAAP